MNFRRRLPEIRWQSRLSRGPGAANPGTDPGPEGTPHAPQNARLGTLRSVPRLPHKIEERGVRHFGLHLEGGLELCVALGDF